MVELDLNDLKWINLNEKESIEYELNKGDLHF
jgi:hypothetical protein